MAQAEPTLFVDDVAQTAMEARVSTVVANTGLTCGGGNNPGIGISTENPGLAESLPSWTLLDQHGNARTPQIGQSIGGTGITSVGSWPGSGGTEGTLPDAAIRFGANPANVNGAPNNNAAITIGSNARLVTLAAGWVEGA